MLIEARDLSVGFKTDSGIAWAVRNLTLGIDSAGSLGIVGESGSGKSTAALALMGLLTDRRDCVVDGDVLFNGQSLFRMPPRSLRQIWGRRISMVFQDPMSALNPVLKIEEQVAELIRRHTRLGRRDVRDLVLYWFTEVGLPDPQSILRRYPHQLSGGQLQRVMIAMALVCEPELIIADEPTTALDLTIQSQILSILTRLCDERRVALVLITHDLAVVAETAHQAVVMYSGKIVEQGRTEDVLFHPKHPYTRGLIAAMPRMNDSTRRLMPIEGAPPPVIVELPGCGYAPRCPQAKPECTAREPAPVSAAPEEWEHHAAACHFA